MIHNPPHITTMLLAWKSAPARDAQHLAALLIEHIGQQSWPVFLQTYRLHLQSIPMPLAREAWGLTQVKGASGSFSKSSS